MKNIIQFRKGFVNLPNNYEDNRSLSLTVVSELLQFGYILDQTAIDMLSKTSKDNIISFHNEIIDWLKTMTGSNRNYKPLWSGFPEEVMSKSEEELWLHQVVHYLSNGDYSPNEWTKSRPTAFEQPDYTVITIGDDEKFLKIFTDLVSVNQSLTSDDLNIVEWFIKSGNELIFPETIPFKETLCTLASYGLNVPVKTVTDVLRIVVKMSGGDISLPKVPNKKKKFNVWSEDKTINHERDLFKFKKFTRKERRFILGLLEKTNCDSSEAIIKKERWVRLGEILHPGEYINSYPKSFKFFTQIRNEEVSSWYSKVNKSFEISFEEGLIKLSERPGEMVRKLDWLIRSNDKEVLTILNVFKEISDKVSNKVLFEIYNHFAKRKNRVVNRSVSIKGKRSKVQLPELPSIKQEYINNIQDLIINTLGRKYSSLPSLGKVWIDDNLNKIPLPSNMRSLNPSLKPRIRGTRTPMGNQNANTIRAFVHWFDKNGDMDIDLSAIFVGMGKNKIISWNNNYNEDEGLFSGDIRHQQGSCAEYIDINIENALKNGYKYVILDIRNFNGGSLSDVEDCVFGWMEREYPVANEIFVPSTLSNTIRLTNSATNTIAAIIDIETQEYIFLDIDQDGLPIASENLDEILNAIKEYTEPPKFSVFDLLMLHIKNRGQLTDNKENANILFSFEEFSNDYIEILKYM
jgi:hypothetical protein